MDGRVFVEVKVEWLRRPWALLAMEDGGWYQGTVALVGLRPVPVWERHAARLGRHDACCLSVVMVLLGRVRGCWPV